MGARDGGSCSARDVRERDHHGIHVHDLMTATLIATTDPAAAASTERDATPIDGTSRRHRWRRGAVLSVAAVGLALVVAGCGAAVGATNGSPGYRTSGAKATSTAPAAGGGTPAVAAAPPTAANNTPPAPATAPKPASAVPQNNGGDSDPDNNGGPDDGDGGI
jgi:hypothetical protein